jgi:hypothetical protein
MLTVWPVLPKPSFINQRFDWHAETFFYQTKTWRMNYKDNCKYNNLVKSTQPQLLQINSIIYIHPNYMDHDKSIKQGDGDRSEKKRPKIQEVGVGQRRRGAMLSV